MSRRVCVVCNTNYKLTKHHVFPVCFGRFMPEQYAIIAEDTLFLCEDCHNEYEIIAEELRDKMINQFGLFPKGIDPKIRSKIDSIKYTAYLLLNRSHKLKKKIKKGYVQKICSFLGLSHNKQLTRDLIFRVANFKIYEHDESLN